MALSLPVQLVVGSGDGIRLDVWDKYSADLSMLAAGSPFTFSLFRSNARQSNWTVLNRSLKLGDRATLLIQNAPQLHGVIEEITGHDSVEQGAQFIFSGRDLAGPAMVWDADPTLLIQNLPLETALARLFAPLGLGIVIGAGADAERRVTSAHRPHPAAPTQSGKARHRHVDLAHPRPGEKMWELAQAIVRRLGYMMWVGPAPQWSGALAVVVDTPAYKSPPLFSLSRVIDPQTGTSSGNILAGGHTVSIREVPTEVNVYTTSQRGDAVSIRQRARAVNDGLANERITLGKVGPEVIPQPRHIHSEQARTLSAAKQEAAREIADRMARFRTYTCAVQGHGQQSGSQTTLYTINAMASVRDDVWGIDEPMLILEVHFTGSRETGQTTQITLGPKDAIQLYPDESGAA